MYNPLGYVLFIFPTVPMTLPLEWILSYAPN